MHVHVEIPVRVFPGLSARSSVVVEVSFVAVVNDQVILSGLEYRGEGSLASGIQNCLGDYYDAFGTIGTLDYGASSSHRKTSFLSMCGVESNDVHPLMFVDLKYLPSGSEDPRVRTTVPCDYFPSCLCTEVDLSVK